MKRQWSTLLAACAAGAWLTMPASAQDKGTASPKAAPVAAAATAEKTAPTFKAVENGNAVPFPMDDVLLYGLISKSAKPDDFAVVGRYLSVEPYAIMLRRDEPQFEKLVNRALLDLFQSATCDASTPSGSIRGS